MSKKAPQHLKKPRRVSLLGSRLTSVLSVALVLIVAGLCSLLGLAVHRASGLVADNTTIIATTGPGTDPLQTSAIKRSLNNVPWATGYTFTDATAVLEREVRNMDADSRHALDLLTDNPYGDEFLIYVADGYRSTDSLAAIAARLEQTPGIELVAADVQALGQSNAGINNIIFYLIILAAALLVISVALIANTISLAIYSRRFSIYTMKLVGATNAFVRRPFVRAGTLAGFVAGIVAATVVCGLEFYLMMFESLVGTYVTPMDIAVTAALLIIAGTFIARTAAWCTAQRYLRKTFDQLFKK